MTDNASVFHTGSAKLPSADMAQTYVSGGGREEQICECAACSAKVSIRLKFLHHYYAFAYQCGPYCDNCQGKAVSYLLAMEKVKP